MTNLNQALKYWPFAGDFGLPGDKALRDGIVTFRARHKCIECLSTIEPGTQGRSLTMLWADAFGPTTGRYCLACTEAQAVSFEDGGNALEKRWEVRIANEQSGNRHRKMEIYYDRHKH